MAIKWPTPKAYIVTRAMAADCLRWSRDPDALDNLPLYSRDQVERLMQQAMSEALKQVKQR